MALPKKSMKTMKAAAMKSMKAMKSKKSKAMKSMGKGAIADAVIGPGTQGSVGFARCKTIGILKKKISCNPLAAPMGPEDRLRRGA